MEYDPKYDAMPLRGKISPKAWAFEHTGGHWADLEITRHYSRKYHRHYDPYKDWWKNDDIGWPKWQWLGVSPSKGYKRKTFRDSRSAY